MENGLRRCSPPGGKRWSRGWKPSPAHCERPTGFWMKALLPGSFVSVKFGINLWSPGKESALSHTAARVPHTPWGLCAPCGPPGAHTPPELRGSPASWLPGLVHLLVQPSQDPKRWPACLPFKESTPNDMGNVGFYVFPKKKKRERENVQPMFSSLLAHGYFARLSSLTWFIGLLPRILISRVRMKTRSGPTEVKARWVGPVGLASLGKPNPLRGADTSFWTPWREGPYQACIQPAGTTDS